MSQRPSRVSDAGLGPDSGGSPASSASKSNRKFWGEEVNDDSIYKVFIKKIVYSATPEVSSGGKDYLTVPGADEVDSGPKSGFITTKDVFRRRSVGKSPKKKHSTASEDLDLSSLTRSDQIGRPSSNFLEPGPSSAKQVSTESLLWETRQIRILKAGTIEHILSYLLHSTPHQIEQTAAARKPQSHYSAVVIEEERNNVNHVMHILFLCYRIHCSPPELYKMLTSIASRTPEAAKHLNYVLHYWISNYADDFFVVPTPKNKSTGKQQNGYGTNGNVEANGNDEDNQRVIDHLLAMNAMDDGLFRRVEQLAANFKPEPMPEPPGSNGYSYSKSQSSVLELDARFVAQQLTAIDLENFLSLKAYTLLNEGPRSSIPKLNATIKNFNLLSRHVVVTILQSTTPDVVTAHWIDIAAQLRRMKNFNSLKAVISGLTNEAIYRLKSTVWSRLNKQTTETFKWLHEIVDEKNQQQILRRTQLDLEGTAKISLQEESFGTIPYLGTFFSDLEIGNTLNPKFLSSANGTQLINVDRWSVQFEYITQIQLLQKNVKAALTAVHQSQHFSGMSQLPTQNATPMVPHVARIFRTWFQENAMTNLNDNDCYKLSLALEPRK